MKNFWNSLIKPFVVLAPMEGVTDVCFREILTLTSKPDAFFTEFTNCDGLFSKGRDEVGKRLEFTENQRPIVAQIWGNNPDTYYRAAKLLSEKGFDGIDINMGCPVRDVIKMGACSGLIENRKLAGELIQAAIEGSEGLPVSVKTRIGLKEVVTESWVEFLLSFNISALTIHGRTSEQQSKVPADWNEIKKAVEVRNRLKSKTFILGNGDVKDYKDAREKAEKWEVDGVMIGRGIFENLWAFDKTGEAKRKPVSELLKIHLGLFEKTYDPKHYDTLKKYFKIYIRDFPGSADLREKMMLTKNVNEALEIISNSKF